MQFSPCLLIVFGLSSKTQWLSALYYADFISFYSPTQLCGGGTTKSNSNELPISVPLSNTVSVHHKLLALCDKSSFIFVSKEDLSETFILPLSRALDPRSDLAIGDVLTDTPDRLAGSNCPKVPYRFGSPSPLDLLVI